MPKREVSPPKILPVAHCKSSNGGPNHRRSRRMIHWADASLYPQHSEFGVGFERKFPTSAA